MAAAFALAIFSGRIVIIFVVQKRLRAFLNHFFTRRGCGGSMLFTDATSLSVWRGRLPNKLPQSRLAP